MDRRRFVVALLGAGTAACAGGGGGGTRVAAPTSPARFVQRSESGRAEVALTVLRPYLGGPGRWFRPSSMDVPTGDVLAEAGRAGYATVVGYGVDSLDFTDPGAEVVRSNVIDVVAAGDIVGLHFGHPDAIAALDGIVDGLEGMGLRPVTVGTLLA